MTPNQFRKIALSRPGITEGHHMGHADFRAHGKVVASLGFPDDGWGMIRLTPEQQTAVCASHADVFRPCNGAWGRWGCTGVRLSAAKLPIVREAFGLLAQNIDSKRSKAVTRTARPRARTNSK